MQLIVSSAFAGALASGMACSSSSVGGAGASTGAGANSGASTGTASGSGASRPASGSGSGSAVSSGSSGAGSSGSSSGTSSGSSVSSGSDSGAPAGPDGGSTAEGGPSVGPSDGGAFPAAEVTRVANWLSNSKSGLENYAYTNIDMYFPVGDKRDRLVNSIVGACAAFAPPLPDWAMYCEAIVTSQIVSESSYVPGNPTPGPPGSPSVVYDSYSTQNGANDPTVGLLQIRFSSTVHDYNYYGPLAKIAAIGCDWPAGLAGQADKPSFWTTSGGTVANLTFMEDPACNIPLAAWYVLMNATGNGGANAVYAADYCAGKGIAGNVVDGLLSHLDGPSYPRPADASNAYPAGIKTRFVKLLGGLPSPDPFGVTLSPSVSQYCK